MLINTMVASTRLSIAAMFDTWSGIDEDEGEDHLTHRLAFAKFYETLWSTLKENFHQLLMKVPKTSDTYFTSLKGLLQISSDLSIFALRYSRSTNSENSYNPILTACESFLSCLLEINSPFNSQYLSLEPISSTSESLTSEWIKNFVTENVQNIQTKEKRTESVNNTGKFEHKSHLLAILPFAHKLLAAYDGIQTSAALRMKTVAIEVIDAVDIRALTEVLLKLSEEITDLKLENSALRAEVSS